MFFFFPLPVFRRCRRNRNPFLSLSLIFFPFFCPFLINTDLCFLLSSFILRFVLSFALLFFYFFLFFGWANVSRDDIKISSLRTGVWFGRRMFHRMCERKFDGSIVLCKKKRKKMSNFRTSVESLECRPQHVRSADEIPFFEASRRKVPTILLSFNKFHCCVIVSTCVEEEESDFPFPRIIFVSRCDRERRSSLFGVREKRASTIKDWSRPALH